MHSLTRLSLSNRALICLVTLAAAAFGLLAIPSLQQQLLPSLDLPAALVTARYPGAAPDIVDQRLVQPLEDAVRGVSGVTAVTSKALESYALVQVELEYGTDIDQATNRMNTAVGRVSSQLPHDADPQVISGTMNDIMPALVLAASGANAELLAGRLRAVVLPEISTLDGVRQADLTGTASTAVTIAPDPAALARAGLTTSSIASALEGAGTAIPAGAVREGSRSLTVAVGGSLGSLDALRDLLLTPEPAAGTTSAAAPRPVRLGDVATVTSLAVPPTSLTRTDGRSSLGITITMTPDGNAVDISHAVRDNLAAWQADLGKDAELSVVFDQAPYIERSIESLATEGVLGLVMAVVVILVFLLSVRSTLVTAVSIPLSVLVALLVLWADGLTLNILTLGALTIAVGRVVDDSIVVLENIKRHLEYGEEKVQAILTGAREVAGAITASTMTTIAVFGPMALVGGMVGELFRPFGITVTVALTASLLVALTIVPVLAFWFLKRPHSDLGPEAVRREAMDRERHTLVQRGYVPVIRFAVRRRWTTVGGALAVVGATLAMAGLLETNFIDESGQDTLSITQTMPPGTSLAATDTASRAVEKELEAERAAGTVTSYQTTVGGGLIPGLTGSNSTATFSVTVPENADRDADEVRARLERRLAGLTGAGEIEVTGAQSGMGMTDVQVIVRATDPATLTAAGALVRTAMTAVTEVKNVSSDLTEQAPRLDVAVRREAAAGYGLTDSVIAGIVASAFRGVPAGELTIGGVPQDVVITAGAPPSTPEELRALAIPTTAGPVPLGRLADIRTVDAPAQVTRLDGVRTVTVTATPVGRDLSAATSAIEKRLGGLALPTGASYEIAGVAADQSEAFGQLGLALLAAIAIVFIIMVATFRSLVQPLVLLVSIPFAATGALLLLLLTRTPLGVAALIGMLMLVGIVVTNAIVLVDLINQYRRRGVPLLEAVVEGGRHRVRPILMTAVATIFALLPMALGLTGEGGFISRPLAIVVIGGLTTSTLLTLVLVPTLYTMVEGLKERRGAGPHRPPGPRAMESGAVTSSRRSEEVPASRGPAG
jgi:HAE1 family hydrophobic/amphiphilic exporter-1